MNNFPTPMALGGNETALSRLTPLQALTRGFESAETGDRDLSAVNADTNIHSREGFRIGALGLMILYQDGSELTDMPEIYRLPNAPHWFSGMANLHGALIPVCDLARYLGIERSTQAKPMLLVLGHGADAAGVVIDGLPLRLRFGAADRAEGTPVPPALSDCIGATYSAGDQSWMDLKVGAFLQQLADELEVLSH